MTVPNSLVVMVPSPSLSKRLNASLNSVQLEKNNAVTYVVFYYLIISFPVYYTIIITQEFLWESKVRLKVYCGLRLI